MTALQRMRFRLYATGIRTVKRAYEANGWYGAANVVLGYVSVCLGGLLLFVWATNE